MFDALDPMRWIGVRAENKGAAMIQTISKVPPRSQLLCIWLVTGDPRQPLTCRWMEDEIPFLTPFLSGAVTGANDAERPRQCA